MVLGCQLFHVGRILPLVAVIKIPYLGCGIGPELAAEGKGVRLVDGFAFLGEDGVFVYGAGRHYADKALPYAGLAAAGHGIGLSIPAVEIANHAYGLRIGSPHRKAIHIIAVVIYLVAA